MPAKRSPSIELLDPVVPCVIRTGRARGVADRLIRDGHLGQGLAGLELEVLDDEAAFLRLRVVGGLRADGADEDGRGGGRGSDQVHVFLP